MLGLILVLCGQSQAKALVGNSGNLNSLLSKTPSSLVLFHRRDSPESSQLLPIFDALSDKYGSKLSMIVIDTTESEDLATIYEIPHCPAIAAFTGDRLLQFYRGRRLDTEVASFCDQMLSAKVTKLNTYFDFFRFQNQMAPANLVLANHIGEQKAQQLAQAFPGLIHIAILSNPSISTSVGVDMAQFSRPSDGFIANLKDINETLLTLARPHIIQIDNEEVFGLEHSPHTLVAIIDTRDPLQRHHVQNSFLQLENIYGHNITYQICDFYKCMAISNDLGIRNYGSPVYVLCSQTDSKPLMRVFNHPSPNIGDFQQWLDEFVLGIKRDLPDGGIPVLYARNFTNIVLDPRKDVVLLIISSDMQEESSSREKFRQLIEIFQPFPSIEFYEFNPRTQKVPGLRIPDSDHPVISIWPAREQSSAVSMPATIPLKALFETIMRTVRTQITPARLGDLNAKVDQMSP